MRLEGGARRGNGAIDVYVNVGPRSVYVNVTFHYFFSSPAASAAAAAATIHRHSCPPPVVSLKMRT